MKTFIVGLFSLAVLASGAAWGHPPNDLVNAKNLPALQGFCKANKGIFVILVNREGEAYFGQCNQLKGPPVREITEKPNRDPFDTTLPLWSLGTSEKTKMTTDPDPCITWTVGGSSRFFCW